MNHRPQLILTRRVAGIEGLVTRDDVPVTIVSGVARYDAVPARAWRSHGQFLTWAEGSHGTVEQAVQVLIEDRQRA